MSETTTKTTTKTSGEPPQENLPVVAPPEYKPTLSAMPGGGYFESSEMFKTGQRIALMMAEANILPKQFAGNMPNILIALDMAARLRMNPIAVMQSIYVVHGRPAWSATFMIASINKSGLFKTPLRYEFSGKPGTDDYGCVAWALDHTGERLESSRITMKMAKDEGWSGKEGSKWKTMPEQMLRYRAASFFARVYCPELTMGMVTQEEALDVIDVVSEPSRGGVDGNGAGAAFQRAMESAKTVESVETDPDDPDWFAKEAAENEAWMKEKEAEAKI